MRDATAWHIARRMMQKCHDLSRPDPGRRNAKTLAEGAVEIGEIGKSGHVGDVGNLAMPLGGIGHELAGQQQPLLEHEFGEHDGR